MRITRIEEMRESTQRAWSTDTCNVMAGCQKPPAYFIRYKAKGRAFKLACRAHAAKIADAEGLAIWTADEAAREGV